MARVAPGSVGVTPAGGVVKCGGVVDVVGALHQQVNHGAAHAGVCGLSTPGHVQCR
jgi:hypothetical protein